MAGNSDYGEPREGADSFRDRNVRLHPRVPCNTINKFVRGSTRLDAIETGQIEALERPFLSSFIFLLSLRA